jgi:hypothetical protein
MQQIFPLYHILELMRVSCTCGKTETFSNKIENFKIRLIRNSEESKTLMISVVGKLCGNETEKILIGI